MNQRLDIRWLDAYQRLGSFLRENKYLIEEDDRTFGFELYGKPRTVKKVGKVKHEFSPADHPLSDLQSTEKGEYFIELVDMYLRYCETIINQ